MLNFNAFSCVGIKFTLFCICINIARPRGKWSQSCILKLLNRSIHISPLGSTRPKTTSSTTANRLIVLTVITEDNCYKQLLASVPGDQWIITCRRQLYHDIKMCKLQKFIEAEWQLAYGTNFYMACFLSEMVELYHMNKIARTKYYISWRKILLQKQIVEFFY